MARQYAQNITRTIHETHGTGYYIEAGEQHPVDETHVGKFDAGGFSTLMRKKLDKPNLIIEHVSVKSTKYTCSLDEFKQFAHLIEA